MKFRSHESREVGDINPNPNPMPLTPRYYIAPTEPLLLRSLGRTTLLPETMGCDILSYHYNPTVCIGFQRKEISDFVSSLSDGRLTKELGQISDNIHLHYAVLIVEGRLVWTTEGRLANGYSSNFDRSTFRKLLAYIQSSGIIVVTTDDVQDTSDTIIQLSAYLAKPGHDTLLRRPKIDAKNSWGRATSQSFASHILQGFPNVGPRTAQEIYRAFGRIPLEWTCSEGELVNVPGIGKVTAKRLMEALR